MNPKYLITPLLISLASNTIHATSDKMHSIIERNREAIIFKDNGQSLQLSGLLLGEAIFSNYNQSAKRFSDKRSYSILCFPRGNLYIDGRANEWTTGHLAFNFRSSCGFGSKNDESSSRKFDKVNEVFARFQNPDNTNYYAQVGIQYLPYGHYPRNVIPGSFTQLLSQTHDGAVVVGTAFDSGFNAVGYVFNGKKKLHGSPVIHNGGASVSYHYHSTDYDTAIHLDWMANIAGGVNHIVAGCGCSSGNPLSSGYRHPVGGLHLSMKSRYEKMDTTLQMTTAINHFDQADMRWQGRGARPKAIYLDAGYSFKGLFKKSMRFGGSVQQSFQSVHVKGNDLVNGLPKYRIQLDLSITPFKQSYLGAHLIWDKDYSTFNQGTGRSSLTGMFTLKTYLL